MTHSVLFVCLHGSAKSVIAAAYFERLVVQRGVDVRAMSAGVEPDAEIPSGVMPHAMPDVTTGLLTLATVVAMVMWRLSPLPLMTAGGAVGAVLRARCFSVNAAPL